MKRIFLFFLLLSCALCAEHSSVCLNMIVKNESKVIRRCLESVKPLIDYWVIVDTGSSDGTQQIIKEFMKGIPGELHERPWVNFAHNRNEALSLAEGKSDYIFFIDADDLLSFSKNFAKSKLDKDAYYITIKYSGLSYDRVQLVKCGTGWKWGGVVHEALFSTQPTSSAHLNDVTMVIVGGGDRSQDPKKFQKDAELLEKALKDEPNNTRYVFYLAQSYKDAGLLELAIKNYEKRVAMGGWEQEVFWSLYEIALLQEALNLPEETVTKSYFKAINYRPNRAEPIYRLSSYYRRKDNHLLAYLLANHGLRIKSSSDPLFVESWIYDYGMLLECSISSYWVGHYEESYNACKQLLANKELPSHVRECVEKNLGFAIQKFPKKEAGGFSPPAPIQLR